jgi:hypothetical protein
MKLQNLLKIKKKRCCNCHKMTANWQRINGGPWHCFDGCYSTTGIDIRKLQHHLKYS